MGSGEREYDYRREEGEGSEGSTRSIAVGATAWLVISRSVGKVQSAVGHGRKKGRNARERDPGFTGDGSEGDRGGEAQTGPGLVILRYHVLRITVSVTGARARVRAMCDSPWCVYVHTDVTILFSRYFSSSLFLSPFFFLSYFSLYPSYLLSCALFSLLPYRLSFSFYPPAATGGSVVFFLPGGTRDSLARARIPWRQIVCNAYLNTDTRAVHTPWSVAYGGGP